MMSEPLLHRDDPAKDPLVGNIKVTRQDWLNAALSVLKQGGVEAVKVAELAGQMGVSRSSFYWYFKNRTDLLNALLQHWERTNTAAMVAQANAPADTITEACCNVFRCNINTALFDNRLDFAIRDWARRSDRVNAVLKAGDDARIAALTHMFLRFDYPELEAKARARVIYYMQLGYDDANLGETLNERLAMVPGYLVAYTGHAASDAEIEAFATYARDVTGHTDPA
ncbi:TetR/AcrR family transcriptional regulator [uncultured Tateyamaria sp.]|uniref:TetR/AcrR family transcriptional regulator n=1 Tax=uncultured Tateyamaria sp. TaxID=455651 RepID=UPI00261D1759|nr:TetR/AcrR family transcriptional regulator [uncultured Tateyamaria sp.]